MSHYSGAFHTDVKNKPETAFTSVCVIVCIDLLSLFNTLVVMYVNNKGQMDFISCKCLMRDLFCICFSLLQTAKSTILD